MRKEVECPETSRSQDRDSGDERIKDWRLVLVPGEGIEPS